jgi:Domain of unknown function (DUF4431)
VRESLTAALIGASVAACSPCLAAAQCLEYGANSLYGTLVRQTYAGPPDYESLTRGDEPLVIWVLLLDRRICAADPNRSYFSTNYEREVQLVLQDAQYEQYRDLLGRKVVVTGELRHGWADHKRLLIVARDIAQTRMRP